MRAIGVGVLGFLIATEIAFAQEEVEPETYEESADETASYEEPATDEPGFDESASEIDESHPLAKLDWVVGPTTVDLGSRATLVVPEGFLFLNQTETTKFQEMAENPTSGKETLIAPDDLRWFGLLEFDTIGYVKDDEEIDADDLLESMKAGTEQGNEERRKRGWAELTITGWRFEPRYDQDTQRLEWAINAVSENQPVVNFNTRLLGRRGVTAATLVADPAQLDTAVGEFKEILTGYQYAEGERYADVQEGDHMAEYGLAALIAGGGAAVAAKSGLLKSLWKILAAAGVAVAALVGKFFKGKKQQDA